MATFSKRLLSGSTNGLPIKVTGTNTGAAVTLHTAVAGTTDLDEVFLFVSNTSASAATITIEWGDDDDPDDLLVKAFSVPANSQCWPVATGQLLQNGLVIRAFAGTANVLNVTGYVNRITA